MPLFRRLSLPILLLAYALNLCWQDAAHAETQTPSAGQESPFCRAIWETVKRLPNRPGTFASSTDFFPGLGKDLPEIKKSLLPGFTTVTFGGIWNRYYVARNYSPLGRNHSEKRPVLAELATGLTRCFPSHVVTSEASALPSGTEWETKTMTFTPPDELQYSAGQQPRITISPANDAGVFLDIVWDTSEHWDSYLKGLQRYIENGCSLNDDACLMRKSINGQ